MKLIAGLGNPGPRYADSRHNIGYRVVDELSRRWSIDVSQHVPKYDALAGDGPVAGDRALLLKPTTFMNLSGRSVSAAWRFYKLPVDDVMVVYDDLDLPVGKVRLRSQGSAGGHNGMTDVIRHLSTDNIARVRVGIGKVHRDATVDYVLGSFAPDEREDIEFAVKDAADAVEAWIRFGIDKAMNEFNRRSEKPNNRNDNAGPASKGDSV